MESVFSRERGFVHRHTHQVNRLAAAGIHELTPAGRQKIHVLVHPISEVPQLAQIIGRIGLVDPDEAVWTEFGDNHRPVAADNPLHSPQRARLPALNIHLDQTDAPVLRHERVGTCQFDLDTIQTPRDFHVGTNRHKVGTEIVG